MMRSPPPGARAADNRDMSAWSVPPALDQPMPRQVRATAAFKQLVGLSFAPFVIVMLFVAAINYSFVHKQEILRTRGVAIEGRIVALRVEPGRRRTIYVVAYRFTPATESAGSP